MHNPVTVATAADPVKELPWGSGEDARQLAPVEFTGHIRFDFIQGDDVLCSRLGVGPIAEHYARRDRGTIVRSVVDIDAREHAELYQSSAHRTTLTYYSTTW